MKSADLLITAIFAVALLAIGALPQFALHFVAVAGIFVFILIARLSMQGWNRFQQRRDPYSIAALRRTQEEDDLEAIKQLHDETRDKLPDEY